MKIESSKGFLTLSSKLTKTQVWREVQRAVDDYRLRTGDERKLKVEVKLNWSPGPPGFEYMMGRDHGWIITWEPL